MTHLIMRRGPNPNKVFELNADVVTIGSGSRNNIVILDNDINREHCRLIRVMADYELHDLGSTRGTFVSGQRVADGWLLKPGSIIELGENVTLEYERSSAQDELDKILVPHSVSRSDKPDPSAYPSLVMVAGPNPGLVYPLKNRIVTMGRDLANDIVIQDPEVSRFHLSFRWSDTTYHVEDMNSTNGTILNGVAMPPAIPTMLHANDNIQIAAMVELRYTWQPDDVVIDKEPRSPRQTGSLNLKDLSAMETNETKLFASNTRRHTSKLGTGLQPGSLIDHLFIAYAREEWEAIVAPLTVILQDAGHKVWADQYLLQGGDDWMLAVEQALSECWLLLVVVSPEALNSRYVRMAYRYFFNREKPVLPLLYTSVEELPLELANLKVVRYDSHDRKRTFDELVAEIRQKSKS